MVAFAAYVLFAAAYTWPLLAQATGRVASEPFDPILNASILWWNATAAVPFSGAWWSPPHFFPLQGVAAFTENLVGLGVIATPLQWLTSQPLLTYNLTFFLTWPLSAIAAYALGARLFRRQDAAFLAGILFGFAPYRLTQIGHLQVLAMFWLPVALMGLHAYLSDRRKRWLALFGAAWLLQSLTNGYYMFFGAVLIAIWCGYFLSSRRNLTALGAVLAAWGLASLPLIPVMWRYRSIHQEYGLTRGVAAVKEFSAQPLHWLSVPDLNWWWSRFLPDSGSEFNLFPGLVPVALLCVAGVTFGLQRQTDQAETSRRRAARAIACAVALFSLAAVVFRLVEGPIKLNVLGVMFRMSGFSQVVAVLVVAVAVIFLVTPSIRRRISERSPFVFYLSATLVAALLACGPEIRSGSELLLSRAPYGWLLAGVPGLEGLRVVARFWMVGALCLAIAAAASFAWLVPRKGMVRVVALLAAVAGGLVDSWPSSFPMGLAPQLSTAAEPAGVPRALIELPLGPKWDAAATFRAVGHRRRLVNGVSGYDPPHYFPLQLGIEARDPSVILALTSFGALDVVVDRRNDPDGGLVRYVEAIPGVQAGFRDASHSVYELPATLTPRFGAPLVVTTIEAGTQGGSAHRVVPADRPDWKTGLPIGGWLTADLGSTQVVAGVEFAAGPDARGLPRILIIELSDEGKAWREAWRGSLLGPALRGAALFPRSARVALPIPAQPARFVRLSRADDPSQHWEIAEFKVLPPGR